MMRGDPPLSQLKRELLNVFRCGMSSAYAHLVLALVDDDEDIRRAVSRLLRSCGHVVHAFESAEAYLARHCDADCAILDIHLPGISGLELEGRMRAAGRDTPVVFITGHDDARTRAAIRRLRVPFVNKPFDEARLLDAIAKATDGRPPRGHGEWRRGA